MSEPNRPFWDDAVLNEVLAWWHSLDENRGDRAMLRRCHSLDDVMNLPAYFALRRRLVKAGFVPRLFDEGLAAVAGVLVHVREHQEQPESVAVRMATPKKTSDSARFSGLRFRRLLECETHADLYPRLIRVMRLLGDPRPAANVRSLASDVYQWESSSNRVQKKWALDYYSKAPTED